MEGELIERYKAAVSKRERAEVEMQKAKKGLENMYKNSKRKDVLSHPGAPEGIAKKIESLSYDEVQDRFELLFYNGTSVRGNTEDFIFTIDREKYRVKTFDIRWAQDKGRVFVFKHKLKKVRERVNELLPYVLHVSAHYKDLDLRKIRKIVDKKLEKREK